MEWIARAAGRYAEQLKAYAMGVDERPVVPERSDAKSYSEQDTFFDDVGDEVFLLEKLRSIADRLALKVREDRKSFRTVTVRVRFRDMEDSSRSISLDDPSDLEQVIYPLLPGLLAKARERRRSVRMVSLRLSGIAEAVYLPELLLDDPSRKRHNERQLTAVVDRLRSHHSIMRGHDLWLKQQERKAEADEESKLPNRQPPTTRSSRTADESR